MKFKIRVATAEDVSYVASVCQLINHSAKQRGTGIAKRSPEYLAAKIQTGDAIIAFSDRELAGFCYLDTWSEKRYVSNSGLVVAPQFRRQGLAGSIKKAAFKLSKSKYSGAKLFGITTSLAVMKINTELGYQAVPFSELTDDPAFWDACKSCPNYGILESKKRKFCLCTGMLAQL